MVFNKEELLNQEEFSEEADYSNKSELSIKEIILRHIRKIGDICCQELTGGYWDKKPIRTQSGIIFSENYHPDLREAYCNAVDFLIDIIYPKGDDKLKAYLDSNEDIEKDFKMKDELEENEYIKTKLMQKRKTFKEINRMFDRTNFWTTTDSSNE